VSILLFFSVICQYSACGSVFKERLTYSVLDYDPSTNLKYFCTGLITSENN